MTTHKFYVSAASKRDNRLFLYSVVWAPGSGYRIKKFTYGPDASRAAGFSRIAAEEIARQLAPKYFDVRIGGPSGETLVERTPEQIKAAEDIAKFNRDLLVEFARLWSAIR